jgi:MFS transporter, DHA1 family, multidrug resistance protein
MDAADVEIERAWTNASEALSRERTSSTSSSTGGHRNSIDRTISRHPTQVHRTYTQSIQHIHTISATRSRAESRPLPGFGGGKPYPPDIPAEREAYVVDFEGPLDPLHPMNWPFRTKLALSAICAFLSLGSTFASSVLSAATRRVAVYFDVGLEVATLSSALYLVGYAVGPSIWGPLSELRGRKLPLLLGSFGFSIFATATAVSKDIQTLMICRFFMGVFGSCPLVVVAGVYSDIWRAEQRGIALVVFASSVFMGPMLGPFIGAFTVQSYLGWRWDCYWSMIMGFTAFILLLLFMKETYAPAVLISKAEELRRRTRNWGIHAKMEEIEIDLKELASKNLSRPMRMFFVEPILLLIGFYLTFVYGLIYLSIAAFPLVFGGIHGIKPGVAELPFFGMALGMILAGATSVLMNPLWVKKYHAAGNKAQPEWRLPLAAFGGVIFAIGLFWFGWTGAYRSVHWIVPTIAGVFIGYGLLAIFMQLIMYIVDAYLML